MDTRTITVKGIGKASQKPDLIIINMSLEVIEMDYVTSLKRAEADLGSLKAALISAGHKDELLVTTNFAVRTKYESRYENDAWKETFTGYLCEHKLKLEFDFALELLGKTIEAITNSASNPRFNIQFSVKDQNSLKDQLLKRAVDDSAHKAEIIAGAAGVKLGTIQKIDYSWSDLYLYSSSEMEMDRHVLALSSAADSSGFDIMPDEVEANDTVTVEWEILL